MHLSSLFSVLNLIVYQVFAKLDLKALGISNFPLGPARIAEKNRDETRCSQVAYATPQDSWNLFKSVETKRKEYCSLYLPKGRVRRCGGVCVTIACITLSVYGWKLWSLEDEIDRLEAQILEFETEEILQTNSTAQFLLEQEELNILNTYETWLKEIFVHRRFTGSVGLKAIPEDLWTLMGLDSGDSIHELFKMTHDPIACSDGKIIVKICYNMNPTRTKGYLQQVHHNGAFTNDGNVFRFHLLKKFLFTDDSGNTYLTDDCVEKFNEHVCYFDKNNTCSIEKINKSCGDVSLFVNSSFVLIRKLGTSDLIATSLHNYFLQSANSTSIKKTPDNGLLILSLPIGTDAYFGKKIIKGKHSELMNLKIPFAKIADLQLDHIEEISKIEGEEIANLQKLRELLEPSILHNIFNYFKNKYLITALIVFVLFCVAGFIIYYYCWVKITTIPSAPPLCLSNVPPPYRC